MKLLKYIVFFGLITSSHFVQAQLDTITVKDYSKDWMYFNGRQLLPLLNKADFEGNVISFELREEEVQSGSLTVEYPGEFSLLIDEALIVTAAEEHTEPLLNYAFEDGLLNIRIYATGLNPFLLKTKLIKTAPSSLKPLQEGVVVVNPRAQHTINNFMVLSTFILLAFFTVLRTIYPRQFTEYFKLERAVSPRELDENLLKSRPSNNSNLVVYLLHSLLLAQLLIVLVHLSGLFPEVKSFYPESLGMAIWSWAKWTFYILLALTAKFLTLILFTALFSFKSFLNNHFFNFLRLSFMAALAVAVITYLIYFTVYPYYHPIYNTLLIIVVLSFIPIALFIYLKLMRTTSFKNLHLFSYLCATELIPFILILSLGFN